MNWTFVFKLMLALCVPFLCHGFGFSRPATARNLNMNRNSGLRRFIMSSDSAKCKPVTGTAVRRVSSHSWRWPKSWPFPPDTFELDKSNPKPPGDKPYSTDKVFDFFESNKDDLGKTLIVGVHVDNAVDRAKNLGWETVPDFKNLSLLAESAFDSIIIASGLDSMNDPLPVFDEIFSMLRPSGVLYACFDKKSQSPNPLKLWSTASDGQKVWLVGSFCHYSNPKGWSCIEGFDLESGSEAIESSESSHLYMIKAQKADLEDLNAALDANELEKRIVPRLNSISFKSPLEASLMAARLAPGVRSGQFVPSDFEQVVARLDDVYSILQDVNEVVIPIPARVSLAYSLLNDWSGSASQRTALRMSVGLEPPDSFWTRVSTSVRDMIPSEKILLLADIISHFGHPDVEALLREELPILLERIIASLKIRLSYTMTDDEIQQIAADLAISEGVRKGFKQNEDLLSFLKMSPLEQLQQLRNRDRQ